jgi:2-amino-4-hydroxy-6-hydroxymethyldihydropteridine diphosphokinase
MTAVYVAAGSNVDPQVNLRRALDELSKHYRLQVSPAYRNKAVGFEGDDFINLVVGFETDDSIDQVIAHLHEAEAVCGRPRNAPKWAPRAMDLDLLLYGDAIRPGLRVPRADLLKRAYMLKPLADLAPELVHPLAGKTMRELWNQLDVRDHAMTPVDLNYRA